MQGLHTLTRGASLAAGLALAVAAHAAPPPKTDAALGRTMAAAPAHGWASAIVRTDGPLTPAHLSQLAELGAGITRRLPLISSVELRVPARNLARLAALPFVVHLSYDGRVKKCDAFTVGSSGAGAAFQQYGLTGQGVTVAVVDSGISPHLDLGILTGSRVLAGVNFVPGTTDPGDYCGHGTHVAGIIAGNGAASAGPLCSQTFTGVARRANLVNVRVLDGKGQGTVGQVVAGLQWVVQNRAQYNIRVVNLSLGHPVGESDKTDPLCQAVEAAWKAGIVVVCAAGNEGRLSAANTAGAGNEGWGTAYGSINSPGNDPYVITVGATKQAVLANGAADSNRADDKIATYSSRGPSRLDLVLKPDIVAPGNRVISLTHPNQYLYSAYGSTNLVPWYVYQNVSLTNNSWSYLRLSGTSMATPVVAGAAALLLEKNPSLSPDTVKARLMLAADKWTDSQGSADPCTYGAGYLNIPAALACTVVAGQPALSPTLAEDASGNVTIVRDGTLWGKSSIWGTGSVTDLRAIWGSLSFAAGSVNTLSGSRALWGKSVWSDRACWGSTSSTASSVDLSSIALNGE